MNNPNIIYWPYAQEKINTLRKWWRELIHVLADFDKTLTYARVNGKETPSIISVLYNEWYLSQEYSQKAKELADIYRPIESDFSIPLEIRKEKMMERWTKHRNLLVESHLSRNHIQKVVDSWIITLRAWCKDFLEMLDKANIPVVILSASWLWKDSIWLYLKKVLGYNTIHVISNGFVRNENDQAIAYQEPIITSLNKDETVISKENFPTIYQDISNRKNVILLGDQIEDIGMLTWFESDVVLKIWFLNVPTPEKIQKYQEVFDIVFLWDSGMEEIVDMVRVIVE